MAYSNLDPFEGIANGDVTIALTRRSRHLQITNDSSTDNLRFRLSEKTNWATLMPTETISMHIWATKVYLNGLSVPYRVWNYG